MIPQLSYFITFKQDLSMATTLQNVSEQPTAFLT